MCARSVASRETPGSQTCPPHPYGNSTILSPPDTSLVLGLALDPSWFPLEKVPQVTPSWDFPAQSLAGKGIQRGMVGTASSQLVSVNSIRTVLSVAHRCPWQVDTQDTFRGSGAAGQAQEGLTGVTPAGVLVLPQGLAWGSRGQSQMWGECREGLDAGGSSR